MKTTRIFRIKVTPKQAMQLRAAQLESARVWNVCVGLHKTARDEHSKWPGVKEMHAATKGQFVLHSQSIQQVFRSFLACIETTKKLRREHPEMDMRYPHSDVRFRPVSWPRQAMSYSDGRLLLPMGRGNPSVSLRVDLPEVFGGCKIVWTGGRYELHVAVEQTKSARSKSETNACVDLGQIHLAAVVTDGGEATVISGRGIRTLKRLRDKHMGSLRRKRSRTKKGSLRDKKLRRVMGKTASRAKQRVRDLRHKATRQAVDFLIKHGIGEVYIGDPHGVRKQNKGRRLNDYNSKWEYGKDIEYLRNKLTQAGIGCFTGTERGTSSHCPRCGYKHKPSGRDWKCAECGFKGHRDIVGGVNMHFLRYCEKVPFPQQPTYLRPGPIRIPSSSSRADTPPKPAGFSSLYSATYQPRVSDTVPSGAGQNAA